MHSTTSPVRAPAARPEIASSWTRSRLSGLREDGTPGLAEGAVAADCRLTRAADPVLERARTELDGVPVTFVLADQSARVVDVRCSDTAVRGVLGGLGIVPGVVLGEEQVGTNAVGTPLETRQGLLVRGPEHFMTAFRPFSCYGQPIIHPLTRRLEGILDIGGRSGEEDRLYPFLARRMVRDIEDRLRLDSTLTQRRLLTAFQVAARPRGRAVVVVGQDFVMATPPALDLLEPADHVVLRTFAEEIRTGGAVSHRLTLVSGRTVHLRCEPIDGVDGVLIEISADRPAGSRPGPRPELTAGSPLLVVGEPGSGRTTEARQAAGPGATTLDATEVLRQGEQPWAAAMVAALETEGPAVVVEDIQLLSEQLTALLAKCLRSARCRVVLTSTAGDHLDGVHASLVSLCAARRDLLPLRRRRHEIPQLAQRMLADTGGSGRTRLTSETLRVLAAQSWPGNLAELHRVVQSLARTRSAGDITPADLPASHRGAPAPASPFRQAEREVIVAAIEAAGGNKLRAARALGVSRSTLYNPDARPAHPLRAQLPRLSNILDSCPARSSLR